MVSFKNLSKDSKILLGLSFLTFLSRVYNLTVLPIFTDEAIYIYWAKVIETTHTKWFISLYDGKPPVLIWIISIFLAIFPKDWYLFAGRLPSVLFSVVAVIGIYGLVLLLFKNKKTAVLASFLYIIFPFNVLYDRMALFDSMLTAMCIWTVYFAIKTAQTLSFKQSLLWGCFLGLAFLSKPTALLFAIITPVCVFVISDSLKNWKRVILLSLVGILIGEAINNLLRISKNYPLMLIKNQQFQEPFAEFIKHPLHLVIRNTPLFFSWVLEYYTIPVFILGIVSFFILLRKNFRIGLIFLLLWLGPHAAFILLGREVFPRYVVFVTPYFIIPLAYVIDLVIAKVNMRRFIPILLFLMLFSYQFSFDYYILTNPPKAPLPVADYSQYVSEHPSGYGLEPIFRFLDNEAKNKKIIVVTQGTFGLYPYAFNLRYWDNKNVTIDSRWPLSDIDKELYNMQKISKVYIILKEHQFVPGHLLLKELVRGEKPGSTKYPVILTTFL